MVRKVLLIAWNEARMSSRGWRFWLLLALVGGISLFARNDYLQRVADGFYLHSAFSFQHPSFWLILASLGLGSCALSLDICGRLRNCRMDKILFPLPVGSLDLMVGRLLGVLIIMVPMSFLGIFSLGLWQYWYGHGVVVWQPFWIAYFLLVLPVIIPVTAFAITLRTYFKHDFATLLVGGSLGAALTLMGVREGILINVTEVIRDLANASPTLGVRINPDQYWIPIGMHGLLAFTCLMLAPLYLRRQEPQRWIVRRTANKWIGFSSLLRVLTNLRFDRHLGWRYPISLIVVLLIFTSSVIGAMLRHQDQMKKEEPGEMSEVSPDDLSSSKIDVVRYSIDITPNSAYNRLAIESRMTLIPKNAAQSISLELDPRYELDEVMAGNAPISFSREKNRVRFDFPEPLAPGTQTVLSVRYHGVPLEFNAQYTSLVTVWYPQSWRKFKNRSDRWMDTDDDIFDADITLHLNSDEQGVFAGDLTNVQDDDRTRVEHWETMYPVNSLRVYWGRYSYLDEEKFGYRTRFYHLPTHDYQARVYLEEIKEQQEYIHDKLGELPFPQLTLVELPYSWMNEWSYQGRLREPWIKPIPQGADMGDPMPGMLPVLENQLCYMNERMWLMDRFDHDPRTIPFYRMLPSTLDTIHDQFYTRLISAYFDHSIHPTGEMAFWVREYLSSYASKLLERNPWRRRDELKYDVGANSRVPLSVARRDNLLTLYKNGQYPQLEQLRGEALFRMIHHLMGEKQWWAFLREMFQKFRFKEMPVEELLPLVEEYCGQKLDWFIKDWVMGSALPEYEITNAEAKVLEDKGTSGVKYETEIRVMNHGTGRMAVPIYLETEMDYITRDLWLDSGEEKTLTIETPHRPVFSMVDPENWILQLPFLNSEKKTRSHSERRVRIQGDDTDILRVNKQDNDQGHFWRHH